VSADHPRPSVPQPLLPPGCFVVPVVVLLVAVVAVAGIATARADAGPTRTGLILSGPPSAGGQSSAPAVPHPSISIGPAAPAPARGTPTPAPAAAGSTRATPTGSGCAAALAYLSAHAAPGFRLVCPGDAGGYQALTCLGQAPCGYDQAMIVIADPCPAAYMNEAHNSWVLLHEVTGVPIPDGNPAVDPYGHC